MSDLTVSGPCRAIVPLVEFLPAIRYVFGWWAAGVGFALTVLLGSIIGRRLGIQ